MIIRIIYPNLLRDPFELLVMFHIFPLLSSVEERVNEEKGGHKVAQWQLTRKECHS